MRERKRGEAVRGRGGDWRETESEKERKGERVPDQMRFGEGHEAASRLAA